MSRLLYRLSYAAILEPIIPEISQPCNQKMKLLVNDQVLGTSVEHLLPG